jgi:hypothetical protein
VGEDALGLGGVGDDPREVHERIERAPNHAHDMWSQ